LPLSLEILEKNLLKSGAKTKKNYNSTHVNVGDRSNQSFNPIEAIDDNRQTRNPNKNMFVMINRSTWFVASQPGIRAARSWESLEFQIVQSE
jgi:hypothetical protein